MAFNKIQPEQIQLHTFFSDSGDLRFTQTNTGVKVNLSRNITGDFNFTGQFKTNGKSVFGLANTGNNIFNVDTGNLLFQGSNTKIGAGPNDGNNIAIMADSTNISGRNNFVLQGHSVSFLTGSQKNTALGRNITFPTESTGITVLKDQKADGITVDVSESLYVQYASGHNFRVGPNFFDGAASFNASGIFSGNIEVLGDAFLSGSTIVNQEYLERHAGGSQKISGTYVYETGFQLPKWGGASSTAGTTAHPATGALAISGQTLCVFVGGSWCGIEISGFGNL